MGGSITPKGTLEVVVDAKTPEGHSVQYVSPAGMHSRSTLGPENLGITLTSPIDFGRRSDTTVAARLAEALGNEGRQVQILAAEDERGEDGRINCDGEELSIQVVALPSDSSFIADASRGSAETTVPIGSAAAWVQQAVLRKSTAYEPDFKKATLLAIDVRAAGPLLDDPFVELISERHGGELRASGFAEVWLVGPTVALCRRIA